MDAPFTTAQYLPNLSRTEETLGTPATRQGVMNTLSRILSRPFVESVKFSARGVEVVWHRDMSDSLAVGEPDDSPTTVLARVEMDEFSSAGSFRDSLFEAQLTMITSGKYPQYLFTDSVTTLKNLLNIPSMVGLPAIEGTQFKNVVGLKTLEVSGLPEESVILLAGETEGVPLASVTHALRIV